jgi:hypothetical protein
MVQALGGLVLVAAGIGAAATPAQASISTCWGQGGINQIYYTVWCTGNPMTEPNQYRAWVKCGTTETKYYGPWRDVDFTEPVGSTAVCPTHTDAWAKGYQTG